MKENCTHNYHSEVVETRSDTDFELIYPIYYVSFSTIKITCSLNIYGTIHNFISLSLQQLILFGKNRYD